MGKRMLHTPITPPFVVMGDGISPALGDDLRVCPFLPVMFATQDHGTVMPNYVVIQAGEPLAVWDHPTFGPMLVPSADHEYTITYTAADVGVVEDIDNPGNLVTAAGASTAEIPALPPIGVANQWIRQNPRLSSGEFMFDMYDTTFKEVALRRRHFMIPFYRRGPKAIGQINSGDLVAVLDVEGNTLSAANRPRLGPARMSIANIVAATQGTVTVTPTAAAHADVDVGDYVDVTADGITIRFEVAAAAATVAWNHIQIAKGADTAALVTNLRNAINASALAERVTATVTGGPPVENLVITANTFGPKNDILDAAGNPIVTFTATINDQGNDGWDAVVVVDGTAGSGGLHADGAYNSTNIAFIMGRCIRRWANDLPNTYDMTKVVTPRGSGLAGTETGGTPQELYAAGNTFEGTGVPSTWENAGALLLAYEL